MATQVCNHMLVVILTVKGGRKRSPFSFTVKFFSAKPHSRQTNRTYKK